MRLNQIREFNSKNSENSEKSEKRSMRLKCLRKESGISQLALAKRLGTSQSSVSRFENNITSLSADLASKLSLIYKVSTDYIFGLTDIRDYNMVLSNSLYAREALNYLTGLGKILVNGRELNGADYLYLQEKIIGEAINKIENNNNNNNKESE